MICGVRRLEVGSGAIAKAVSTSSEKVMHCVHQSVHQCGELCIAKEVTQGHINEYVIAQFPLVPCSHTAEILAYIRNKTFRLI